MMDELPFAFTVPAPAKLNLGLEVVGRRADGYHDLATIFLTVSLFDELSVASAPGTSIGLECYGSDLPPQENLVWRAAEAMQHAAPGNGALLRLEKRIPIAAGLGGASSDAAATLLALRELWQAGASDDMLAKIALKLGSDVPFLLRGGCALGRGRGEELFPLPQPLVQSTPSPQEPSPPTPLPRTGRGETDLEAPCGARGQFAASSSIEGSGNAAESPSPAHRERGWGEGSLGSGGEGSLLFLIVAPRIQIPRKTASLFAALQPGDFSDGSRIEQQAERLRAGLPLDPALLGNAFSRALYALRPDVEAVAAAMREAGAEHVALSGAGPAHYAVFDDMGMAQLVKRRLEDRLGDTAETFLTVPVPPRETALNPGQSQP
jgi:4-diphosphocytidyl-2C-methyl-D-erythritol kinase